MDDKNMVAEKRSLRQNFFTGRLEFQSDEIVLKLLLSSALPNRDVQPIVEIMLERYVNLSTILALDYQELCKINGIKENTATLIKLMDWVRKNYPLNQPLCRGWSQKQTLLIETKDESCENYLDKTTSKFKNPLVSNKAPTKLTTGLFSNALMKETIDTLPVLPDTHDFEEIKVFLRNNLRFNSVETRKRYASYITKRMFPGNKIDTILIKFAKKFRDKPELKDVCFYRFCKSEPLMYEVIQKLLVPSIGQGWLDRGLFRDFVFERTNVPRTISNSSKAIIDALSIPGIVRADKKKITFGYRKIPLPALAFVIYSEFPPGMHHIKDLENNKAIRSMLWNPDRLLPSLYELRNQGMIAKISEIDNIRQFTTSFGLETAVIKLLEA